MLKILLKAVVLVFIILSIYFIVNPSACSNLMAGRVVNTPRSEHPQIHPSMPPAQNELLMPGDHTPLPSAQEAAPKASQITGVTDTNSLQTVPPADISTPEDHAKPEDAAPAQYSQEDIDYAVASRYVELEREYAKDNKPLGKEASREISYIVMDDFEMSPQEWESFLTRATASNLFNKVREEMPE